MFQVINSGTAAGAAYDQLKSKATSSAFMDVLTQSSRTYTTPAKASNAPSPSTLESQSQSLLSQLDEYLREHPVARLRKAVMEAMGITEEDLNTMTPDARQAAEDEISRRIQEKLKKPTKDVAV